MVDALLLWSEVVHVFHPLRPRTQIATETEGLHPETLSYPVLPGAEEFHHHKLDGWEKKREKKKQMVSRYYIRILINLTK